MAFDFSNYLHLSDSSTEFDADWRSEPSYDTSNAESGCRYVHEGAREKLCEDGICQGRRGPPSGQLYKDTKHATEDCDDDVLEKIASRRPSAEATPSEQRESSSAKRILSWETVSHGTLSWNDQLDQLSKKQLLLMDFGRSHSSVGEMRKILQRLKTTMELCPTGLNCSDPGRLTGADPDVQDHDRSIPQQPPYRSRRSLPCWLTHDHVTTAKHEARKKYSRRGSVKFADEFGLNLNTFAMIPSRFSAQAQNDVNLRLHLNNRKWNSDDRISAYNIHRTAATDGFRGMRPRWDLACDLGLFHSDDEDEKQLLLDWASIEFRSKKQFSGDALQSQSNDRRIYREKRSSKREATKPETPNSEVAKLEAEAEVDRQRHEFRLRFEQPFADLDRFQRKLRANFLCLENVRVDDRSSRSGEDDLGGTGPPRKRQGTTILCSIKVRHTEGGVIVVFSRCTDNDWVTYADLPAQHLSGVTNLGFDYDTFCFAVRKPVHPPRGEEGNLAASSGPTSAVEFALCCRVTNESGTFSHWDNNDGANYRIEWFDD